MSTLFSGHYLRNRSTLDIGVLGYIGIVQHKEHSPEVLSLPPGTPCIYMYICWLKRMNYCSMHGFEPHKAIKPFKNLAVQVLWINTNQNCMHE